MDLEPLNAERHLGLHQAEVPADGAHFVQIVAAEFAMAAATCPIFLTKSPETGQFYAGAMFGFEPGENLLKRDAPGRRAFLPLDFEQQGCFLASGGVAIDPGHRGSPPDAGRPCSKGMDRPARRCGASSMCSDN